MNMEINKMAGALLGSLLGVMALGMFSNVLYAPDPMKKAGYDLPAAEAAKADTAKDATSQHFPVQLAKAAAKKSVSKSAAKSASSPPPAPPATIPPGPAPPRPARRSMASSDAARPRSPVSPIRTR